MMAGTALVLVVAACQDATAPGNAIAVTLDSVGTPGVLVDSTGKGYMQCRIGLTARNAGTVSLRWHSAELRLYPGGDTTRPANAQFMSADSLTALWGAPDLRPGAKRTATVIVRSDAPYFGRVALRYQDSTAAGIGSAAFSFLCGPPGVRIWPAAPKPAITAFTIPGADTVARNHFLPITLALSDSAGLFTALVHNDNGGACPQGDILLHWDDLPHGFASPAGDLAMFVPLSCPTGPLRLILTVRNALNQTSMDTVMATVK